MFPEIFSSGEQELVPKIGLTSSIFLDFRFSLRMDGFPMKWRFFEATTTKIAHFAVSAIFGTKTCFLELKIGMHIT